MPLDPSSSIRKPFDLSYDGVKENAVFNFFNAVYAWMCVGLAVTAISAWFVSRDQQLMQILFQRGVLAIWLIGTLLLVWAIQSVALRISAAVGTVLFLLYAAIVGMMLSGILLAYTTGSIVGAFALTAGTFGAMSIYGYITKRDLTSMGSFLMMAVFGIFIALLVNIFLANDALSWILTYAILFVFIGLTMYDTQKLKQFAYQNGDNATLASRMVVVGSLMLYIDFLNIFMSLLRIFGKRR
jgi:FtsH-binding integral membrane protein